MDKLERTYALDRLLAGRRTALPMRTITQRLECSEATVRRLFGTLRDRYGAPLAYDREARGWRYDTREGDRPCQIRGLWFSEAELYALLAAHQLLAEIPPGLLQGEVAP